MRGDFVVCFAHFKACKKYKNHKHQTHLRDIDYCLESLSFCISLSGAYPNVYVMMTQNTANATAQRLNTKISI